MKNLLGRTIANPEQQTGIHNICPTIYLTAPRISESNTAQNFYFNKPWSSKNELLGRLFFCHSSYDIGRAVKKIAEFGPSAAREVEWGSGRNGQDVDYGESFRDIKLEGMTS